MSTNRLQKLLDKKAAIDAQIQQQRARERGQKRKDDTRRKIIAGALALEHIETNPDSDFTQIMLKLLNRYVTRPKERALFGLPPVEESENLSQEFGKK